MKRILMVGVICVFASFHNGWGACNQQFEECSFDILDVVGGVLKVPCKLLSACLSLTGMGGTPVGRVTSLPREKIVPKKKRVSEKPQNESPPEIKREASAPEQPEPPPIKREAEPEPSAQAQTSPREQPSVTTPSTPEPEERVKPRQPRSRPRKVPCGSYYVPRLRYPIFPCR